MPVGQRNNPFPSYNFAVEIEGLVSASFSEVSGLGLEIEVNEYREGGQNEFIHKRAGSTKYPNLILKRGAIGSLTWYNWWNDARNANPAVARAVVVQLLNEDRSGTVLRWTFLRAQPINYQYSALNALVSETLIESLELTFERMEME